MINEETIEHLVIINGLLTNFTSKPNELIELNLCSYDVNKKQVSIESSFFIRPVSFSLKEIEMGLLSENKIGLHQLEAAEEITEVLKKIRKFFYDNYVNKNLPFGLVFKDEKVNSYLKFERDNKQYEDIVPYQKERSFNVFEEFRKFYNIDKTDLQLDDMLQYLHLKQTEPNRPSLKDLNTMVRLVNRMIKDCHVFKFVKSTRPEQESISQVGNNNTALNETSLTSIITLFGKCYYIRLKNFPGFISKADIKDLLYLYDPLDEDIEISYDIFGRKTGDVCIRTYHEGNYREMLTNLNYYYFNGYLIDAFESTEADFNACKKSEEFLIKYPLYVDDTGTPRKIFLKMSKIPYSAQEDSIKAFFKNYILAENGIKMNRYRKGNFTGEAVISFNSEADCQEALQRENGRILMNQ